MWLGSMYLRKVISTSASNFCNSYSVRHPKRPSLDSFARTFCWSYDSVMISRIGRKWSVHHSFMNRLLSTVFTDQEDPKLVLGQWRTQK